ncbi:hypothetical protein HDU76_010399, partial [Blyttiomyces sp. JEL0837]
KLVQSFKRIYRDLLELTDEQAKKHIFRSVSLGTILAAAGSIKRRTPDRQSGYDNLHNLMWKG